MESILVTGGTGTLGRHVVRRLRRAGHDVRVLTRRRDAREPGVRFFTGDLVLGAGIEAAIDGAKIIIHCAGGGKDDEIATRNLVSVVAHVGAPHLVYISVVGADRIPMRGKIDRALFGYFDMKRRAEEVIARSRLPWTTLRATQFHDLAFLVALKLSKLPIVPVPSHISFQPVDADEVAERLVDLALSPPSGLAPDIGGPRVYEAAELMRIFLGESHQRRTILPLHVPGEAARALRSGVQLTRQTLGRKTWEDFVSTALRQVHRPTTPSATPRSAPSA